MKDVSAYRAQRASCRPARRFWAGSGREWWCRWTRDYLWTGQRRYLTQGPRGQRHGCVVVGVNTVTPIPTSNTVRCDIAMGLGILLLYWWCRQCVFVQVWRAIIDNGDWNACATMHHLHKWTHQQNNFRLFVMRTSEVDATIDDLAMDWRFSSFSKSDLIVVLDGSNRSAWFRSRQGH